MAGAAYYDFFRKITLQPDGVTLEADSTSDTLTITGGNGVAFNPDANTDSFEIDVDYQLYVPIGTTRIRLQDVNANTSDINLVAGSNITIGRNSDSEITITATVGGSSKSISNASATNPVVITTTSDHGFTEGLPVTITDVVGMTELNGNEYYMDILTGDTFALYTDSNLTVPLDGTLFTPYSTGGVATAEYATPTSLTLLNDVDLTGTPPVNKDVLYYNGVTWLAQSSTNWDTAYGWGDHSLAGYLTSETDPVFSASDVAGVTSTDISNWDAAYGWGDHGAAGYLTSYTTELSEDTTPQLGGNLDVNGQSIVSTSDGNITISPDGTGVIQLNGTVSVAGTVTTSSEADLVLSANGNTTTNLIRIRPSSSSRDIDIIPYHVNDSSSNVGQLNLFTFDSAPNYAYYNIIGSTAQTVSLYTRNNNYRADLNHEYGSFNLLINQNDATLTNKSSNTSVIYYNNGYPNANNAYTQFQVNGYEKLRLTVGGATLNGDVDVSQGNLTVTGSVQAGAFKGSVFGDDSTPIVDAINNRLVVAGVEIQADPIYTTKTVQVNGSIRVLGDATDYYSIFDRGVVVSGTSYFYGKTVFTSNQASTPVSATTSGSVTMNWFTSDTHQIFPTGSWTLDMTSVPLDTSATYIVTVYIFQGATAYFPSTISVNGNDVTTNIFWQNGSPPTPTSSGIDLLQFQIVVDGASTYRVLGQMTTYA